MADTKRKFLIRSSEEILGPYTKEEIITLIKKSKISIFDEVTEPYKIWTYLENHDEFKKIVQSMNIQTRLTNFLTQVSQRISVSKRKDNTQTTKDTVSLTQTKKDFPQEVSFNLTPETTQSPKDHESPIKSQLKTAKKISVRQSPLRKEKPEEKLEKKIGFLVRLSWKLIIFSSFLIAGVILYKISYIPIKEKNQLMEAFNSKGKSYYKKGDFKRAMPFFEKVQPYLTEEEKFSFSILLLQNNRLEESLLLKEEITDPAILQKETWTLLEGLTHFYSRRYSKAEKSFHSVILKNNKETLNLAQLNLALLKLENRQYTELINEVNQLLIRFFNRGMIWYLKALYFLNEGKLNELENYLLTDLDILELKPKYKPIVIEYKQELLFLLAYTYMKAGKTEEKHTAIKRLLNQDPYFFEEYSYSPFIAKNKLNWRLLYPYCNEAFNSNPEESLSQALYGLCLIKTNQLEKAKYYIEQAKKQEPDNSLFLSLYAYLLIVKKEKTQNIEQAFSVINYDSKSTKKNNLPFIIKARFFEQSECWDCALLVWKDLIRQDINNISGLAGISFNSYQMNDKKTGSFYKDKTLKKYPYHIKVLPFE